jgi:hypothetical protein
VIRLLFGWEDNEAYQFIPERPPLDKIPGEGSLNPGTALGDLCTQGVVELLYEYGAKWVVRIIFLSFHEAAAWEQIRCVAGAGAAPPGFIDGPIRYRKYLAAREKGEAPARPVLWDEASGDFDPELFDVEICNRHLTAGLREKSRKSGPLPVDTQGWRDE